MNDSSQIPGEDGPSAEIRLGRILNEFQDRLMRGESVSVERLLADYPDLAAELRSCLIPMEDLRGAGASSGPDINPGRKFLSDLPMPSAIGNFKTIELVGRGGMGIVIKALDTSLDRIIALKLLRPEYEDDSVALERFKREAKAVAGLRHDNIVTVYSVSPDGEQPFIAMEYVDGSTLAQVIRSRGALDADLIRSYLGQILSGLAAAHEVGLIHRDVKSANILIEKDGQRLKIADFGLARIASSQIRITTPLSVMGTMEYMSPEQARGEEDLDCRTDIYSVGVVLYEMLTGRTPFAALGPAATLLKILNEPLVEPRRVNPEADAQLAALAMNMMVRKRADRIQSAADALEILESRRVPRMRYRRRLQASAVAVILLGGLFSVFVPAVWPSGNSMDQNTVSGATQPSVVLFEEHWPNEEDTRAKWEFWGEPEPILHDGKWHGDYCLDPGGDDYCPSGAYSLKAFSVSGGSVLQWSAITLASESSRESVDRGIQDQELEVGLVSIDADIGLCAAEGRRRMLVSLFIMAGCDKAYLQIRGAALRGPSKKVNYESDLDRSWAEYELRIGLDGRVSALRDGHVVAAADMDPTLLDRSFVAIEGRSKGRGGDRDFGVDNITLMSPLSEFQ